MKQLLISLIAVAICSTTLSAQQTRRQLIKKLDAVYNCIEDLYVEDRPLEPLVEEAIRTTLQSLDPHSQYLTKEEMEASEANLKGRFVGIGTRIITHNDTLVVYNTMEGSPAKEAGILPNDRIVTIDNQNVVGGDRSTTKALLRGKAGSSVSLGIVRHGVKEPITIKLKRDHVSTQAVEAFRLDSIGYIGISKFTKSLVSEFHKAYTSLGDVKSLMIDLRGNGGGYMSTAFDLSTLFLEKNDVVVITESKRKRKVFLTSHNGELKDMPLVVIINEDSASASEIFAGAMQDNDRATIVGRTSYGKGLIQKVIKYKDGSGWHITTAQYKTPSGRPIQRPYTPGKNAAYRRDTMRNIHPDSIERIDSLKFKTLKLGREIYAGGGIIPDIYTSADDIRISDCVFTSLSKDVVEHTIIEYWDLADMSNILQEYPTMQSFNQGYNLSQELWDIFYSLAGYSAEDINENDHRYLEALLYASMAEQLYGIEAGDYIYICKFDFVANRALAVAKESITKGNI